MNYLQLCVRTREKADIPGTGPANVTSQTGLMEKLVGWVRDGWEEIQSMHEWWEFMLRSATANLVAGTDQYTKTQFFPSDFSYLWPRSIYLKLNGVKKGRVQLLNWPDYRQLYRHEILLSGPPSAMCVAPTGEIYFNSIPDQNYTIDFDYQKQKQILAANSDVPALDVDFHDVIWRKALVSYGEHFSAPEVYEPASLYLDDRIQELEDRYLPEVTFRNNVYDSA